MFMSSSHFTWFGSDDCLPRWLLAKRWVGQVFMSVSSLMRKASSALSFGSHPRLNKHIRPCHVVLKKKKTKSTSTSARRMASNYASNMAVVLPGTSSARAARPAVSVMRCQACEHCPGDQSKLAGIVIQQSFTPAISYYFLAITWNFTHKNIVKKLGHHPNIVG